MILATASHACARGAGHALDWLCPASCLLCATPGPSLCAACRADTVTGMQCCCPRCAVPLPPRSGRSPCGRCLRRAPAYDRTIAAAVYDEPFAQLIRGFKYGATLAYAPLFAEMLHARVVGAEGALRIDLVVAMPLSRERIATRGFNQAIEIGRMLAARLDRPLDASSVLRILDTPPQAALTFAARRRNVLGAFAVIDERHPRFAGKHVAVVDDVMTTGATLDELARTLKRAGAASVTNCVVARTP